MPVYDGGIFHYEFFSFMPHLQAGMFSLLLLWHVIGSGLWLSYRITGDAKQVNFLRFTYSDRYIFTPKLQNSEHLGVIEIYHSQFQPQSQKNI